jgi:Vault protein inter-alpha-trypsin domain
MRWIGASAAMLIAMTAAAQADPAVSTVMVTTGEASATEVVLPIELPDGAHVTAMAIVGDDGTRLKATAMRADRAAGLYQDEVDRARDPALLEQRPDGRVVLHVYPVTRDRPVRIELTVADRGLPIAPVALYAGPPPGPRGRQAAIVTCRLFAEAAVDLSTVGAHEIRRLVRLHTPQLRRCYSVALQRDRALEGTAALHFAITPSGTIGSVSVDGTLGSDEVRACLAAEVAGWRVHAGSETVVVNYPLRFVPPASPR